MGKAHIYIDFGFGDDVSFGNKIQKRLLTMKGEFVVKTYSDYQKEDKMLNKFGEDWESLTLHAVDSADIVIPILSADYFSYLTRKIQNNFEEIQGSKNRYLFPMFYSSFDWSDVSWIVKSNMTPDESKPFEDYQASEQENIISVFIKTIETVVLNINNKSIHAKTPIKQGEKFIFISHDHDDGDFAELLKLKLEKENLSVWLDNESLKIGQDWRDEIDTGIETSLAMIVIMTPEARKSEYVTYEWAFAWGKGKKIFPIMLKQTQLHPRLESLQYLDFTNRANRPWEELIKELKKTS